MCKKSDLKSYFCCFWTKTGYNISNKVKDVKKYNHAVAKLWFAYAAVLELLGLPLLAGRQNSPVFIITVLGTVAATVGLAAGYHFILAKHQEQK